MSRVLWVDASAGAAGDMLLGALVGVGVPLARLQGAVDAVAPEPVRLRVEQVRRGGLAATRVHVECAAAPYRTWRDVRDLLGTAPGLAEPVRSLGLAVFGRLAAAEGVVHGVPADEVHFHEVGALDAIADVVAACAGLVALAVDRVVVSPVTVGCGWVGTAHGRLPVPVPAVVELLRGAPSAGGDVPGEATTPTGAALLATWAAGWGPQPAMAVTAAGLGAGARDPQGRVNAVRLLLGEAAPTATPTTPATPATTQGALVLEANVDDLDPRLWPHVLDQLLRAGAADAWLVPIVMKKGRPAHTLHALVEAAAADAVRAAVLRETTTIGLRERAVRKTALERTERTVAVDGEAVRVKLAWLDGVVVNAQPEWDDVAAAARRLDRPAKQVLAEAVARAGELPL